MAAAGIPSGISLTCVWQWQSVDKHIDVEGQMRGPLCQSTATTERRERTALGDRRWL